jgi:DNA-binding NtrC family response regulator
VVLSSSDFIRPEDLATEQNFLTHSPAKESLARELSFDRKHPITLDELSKKYIQFIFDKNEGAKEQTAKDLGIDRKTLYRKLKEMDLN